jgi:hypothetical protein
LFHHDYNITLFGLKSIFYILLAGNISVLLQRFFEIIGKIKQVD